MNIREQLLLIHSKENSQKIAAYIGKNLKRYTALWEMVQHDDPPIPQRGSWVLDHCPMSYTSDIKTFVPEMIDLLELPVHDAVKRNLVKILAQADIPEDRSSSLFDHCIDWIIDAKTPIAIKAHCMDIAANIAMPFPELLEELKVVIKDQMEHGSKGLLVAGGRSWSGFEMSE